MRETERYNGRLEHRVLVRLSDGEERNKHESACEAN